MQTPKLGLRENNA